MPDPAVVGDVENGVPDSFLSQIGLSFPTGGKRHVQPVLVARLAGGEGPTGNPPDDGLRQHRAFLVVTGKDYAVERGQRSKRLS